MSITGKEFEFKVRDSLGDIFHYRLIDNVAWMSKKSFYTPSNYSDFIVFYDRSLFFLEVKTIKGKSIPFRNFTKGQRKGMEEIRKIQDDNINYVVLIYFYEPNSLFLINANDMLDFKEQTKRKSYPLSLFEDKGEKIKINGKNYSFKIKDEFNKVKRR